MDQDRKFKGWEKLAEESHGWFEPDVNYYGPQKAVLDVYYDTELDEVWFHVELNESTWTKYDDPDIVHLGYVTYWLCADYDDEYADLWPTGLEWCVDRYEQFLAEQERIEAAERHWIADDY